MIVILIIIGFSLIKRSKLKTAQLLAVHAFQEENKLSNRDLKVFKEVMGEAKNQILLAEQLAKQMKHSVPAIATTLEASKELFKYLMEEPKELILYGDFLYRDLPAFCSVLERRNTMESAGIASDETFQTQNELDNMLTEVSKKILKAYNQYQEEQQEEVERAVLVTKKGENG